MNGRGAAATLRIEGRATADLDTHIAQLGWVRLVRSDAGLLLECPVEDAILATALLARAGARGIAVGRAPSVPSELVPAIMSDLGPVKIPGTIDSVTVRSLDVGEATARLTSRPRLVLRRRRAEGGVRAILRAEDGLIGWSRVLWARPSQLRSRYLRGARPVVFDRGALERVAERYALTRAGEIARWARG